MNFKLKRVDIISIQRLPMFAESTGILGAKMEVDLLEVDLLEVEIGGIGGERSKTWIDKRPDFL